MEKVKIYASWIDDTTKKQINTLAASEAYKDAIIRVMPDCHAGSGCTIGSVIQYTNRVVPNTVGVDIGCGMLVLELGHIDVDLKKLDEVVNTYIPSGFNVHATPLLKTEAYDIFNCQKVLDRDNYLCALGSLGGGNHFIELDADDEDNKYLVIHSGSRNLGVRVCNYWQEIAISKLADDSQARKELIARLKEEGRAKDIQSELQKLQKPVIDKDLAYLEGDDLEDYLFDMRLCQHYAKANRGLMARIITEKMGWKVRDEFTTIHNYIDIPHRIIRKGAIRAKLNEKVIIPINMRDGSLICEGKGNPEWLNSAPHGAGRVMSRKQAFETLSLEDYEHTMCKVFSTSVCQETLDEAPMVYKPMEIILSDIIPTVEVKKVIKPLWNFKAKASEWNFKR